MVFQKEGSLEGTPFQETVKNPGETDPVVENNEKNGESTPYKEVLRPLFSPKKNILMRYQGTLWVSGNLDLLS